MTLLLVCMMCLKKEVFGMPDYQDVLLSWDTLHYGIFLFGIAGTSVKIKIYAWRSFHLSSLIDHLMFRGSLMGVATQVIIYKTRIGAEIDSYEAVVRENGAPIERPYAFIRQGMECLGVCSLPLELIIREVLYWWLIKKSVSLTNL